MINEAKKYGAFLEIIPAVNFREIISFNKNFDVGYIAQSLHTSQKKFALGNKFFEYIHAGLALCIDKSLEYKKIIKFTKNAFVLEDINKIENIYKTINSIERNQVEVYKKRSIRYSKLFDWESESIHMKNYIKSNIINLRS